jgi:hypothetical protein
MTVHVGDEVVARGRYRGRVVRVHGEWVVVSSGGTEAGYLASELASASELVALVANGRPRTEALPAVALEIIVGEPWRGAERVQLHAPSTGEIREGTPGAVALVLLEETGMIGPLEDYCSECPHCEPTVSVALAVGDDNELEVVGAEPCEWCGYDFGTVLFGPDRHECRDEEHLAHGVGCANCGACLHASHGR